MRAHEPGRSRHEHACAGQRLELHALTDAFAISEESVERSEIPPTTAGILASSIDGLRTEGDVRLRGESVYRRGVDVISLRKRMSMVFQRQNPFPKSIYENVVYALRIDGEGSRAVLDEVCERSLRGAALWDEVKDRLGESALRLSGGQQQRLCIARMVAVKPEVLLFDEPTSALDPISTAKIEELIAELKNDYTIGIVTHNMQQAARISDDTGFFLMGRLVEFGRTEKVFQTPAMKETEDYITGRFG